MRIFGRKEEVAKKPVYCWTCAIEVECPPDLEINTQNTNATFQQLNVVDFKIIH